MNFRTKLINIGDIFYYKALEKQFDGMKNILDVGCGSWSPLANVKKTFISVGVDIHKPSIEEIKKKKIHNEYKVGDVLKISEYFKPKSFDAVVALDVIEHFKKNEGIKLMEQMEKIARKRVIIVTPYGFTYQHPCDGNPYQEHKSGWYIEDFKKRGYNVYGMRGFRFIRSGEYATIVLKPWLFWGVVSTFSQLLVYNYPSLAYQLFAVKNIE